MSKESMAAGAARGATETLAAALTASLAEVVKHGTEKVTQMIDALSKDILSPRGTMDDSAGAIIKTQYRLHDAAQADVLIRLFNLLTKPVQDDFIVISVGMLVLTGPGGKSTPMEGEDSIVKGNLLLLGIDFTDPKTFSALFTTYDQLVQDFQKLEPADQANATSVETLVKASNLYGDDQLKKKLAGLLMHIKNWKQALTKTTGSFLKAELPELVDEIHDMSDKALAWAKKFAGKA